VSEWREIWANGLPDAGKPKNQAIGWLQGDTVPSTVVRGYDLRKPGGHHGNVG